MTSILNLIADWRNGQGHRQRQTGIKRQQIIISTGPPSAIHDKGPTSHCFRNRYTVIKEFCFPLKIKWHGLHLPGGRGLYISILLMSSREQIPKIGDPQTMCGCVAPSFMNSEASCCSVHQKKSSKTYMHRSISWYIFFELLTNVALRRKKHLILQWALVQRL